MHRTSMDMYPTSLRNSLVPTGGGAVSHSPPGGRTITHPKGASIAASSVTGRLSGAFSSLQSSQISFKKAKRIIKKGEGASMGVSPRQSEM